MLDHKPLAIGAKIEILEDGKVIDEAVVLDAETEEIEIKSLRRYPEKTFKFALIGDEWRLLFIDPTTGRTCFSRRAPTYKFELA